MNIWMFAVIQAIISVILTFILIIGILVTDNATSGWMFLWCFLIGMVASIPLAWLVYKRMHVEK